MYLTKWGGLSGDLPKVSGKVYFVAPSASYNVFGRTYSASDGNRGEDPDKALVTLSRALELAEDGKDDAIILLPGDHTVATASAAVSKSKLTIMGLPGVHSKYLRPQTTITTSVSADEIMNVTAADVTVANLGIIPITASDAVDLSAAADRFHLLRCYFDLATPAVNVATVGLTMGAADQIMVEDCFVLSDGAQGNAIVATGSIDATIAGLQVHHSAGTWASMILCGAATTGLAIVDGRYMSRGTAVTVGVNGTGATIASGVSCIGNHFGSLFTVPVDNFDAGECELSENYHLGVGGTDGGALITVIT